MFCSVQKTFFACVFVCVSAERCGSDVFSKNLFSFDLFMHEFCCRCYGLTADCDCLIGNKPLDVTFARLFQFRRSADDRISIFRISFSRAKIKTLLNDYNFISRFKRINNRQRRNDLFKRENKQLYGPNITSKILFILVTQPRAANRNAVNISLVTVFFCSADIHADCRCSLFTLPSFFGLFICVN